MINPMGTKGNLANAFATILRDMWQGESQCLIPVTFRVRSCLHGIRHLTEPSCSGLSVLMPLSSAAPNSTIRKSSSTSCWTAYMRTSTACCRSRR